MNEAPRPFGACPRCGLRLAVAPMTVQHAKPTCPTYDRMGRTERRAVRFHTLRGPPMTRTCSVPGCARPHKARGLCNSHHAWRRRRHQEPVDPVNGWGPSAIRVLDTHAEIVLLHRGKPTQEVAVIDRADVSRCRGFRWWISGSQRPTVRGVKRGGPEVSLGRHLLGLNDESEVDYIDRDPLNLRRANLQPRDHRLILQNQGPRTDNASGYRGVSWCKARGGWRGRVKHKYREHTAGVFDTPEKAHEAVVALRASLYENYREEPPP